MSVCVCVCVHVKEREGGCLGVIHISRCFLATFLLDLSLDPAQ